MIFFININFQTHLLIQQIRKGIFNKGINQYNKLRAVLALY